MLMSNGTIEAIERSRMLRGFTETIDAVFEALQENMPDYLKFAGDDRAAELESALVYYLESCDSRF